MIVMIVSLLTIVMKIVMMTTILMGIIQLWKMLNIVINEEQDVVDTDVNNIVINGIHVVVNILAESNLSFNRSYLFI